jgi:radical SAM protein with 4Fe4S-binding SPASM domain
LSGAECDLSWIDDFWARAGSHIFARVEDGVLILPPNRVYKANATAASLVSYLRRGGKAASLVLPSAEATRDTASFFGDLAALYRGDEPVNGTVSSVSYDFSFTRLPVLAELAVTYRCNNACRFCYALCDEKGRSGAAMAAERRPELSTRDFQRIIEVFARDAKVPFFSFTGGEPLLRDDLETLTRGARTLGLATNLVTNGTLADRSRASSLKKAGLGSAQVSIEAPDARLHDSLVGRNGAFAEACAGIAALRSAGIPTQTNTTITKENIDLAAEMPSFLASLGVERFAMNLFIPTRGTAGDPSSGLFVPYEEIGSVVDAVVRAAKRAGLVFYWYSPTPFCSYNPIARVLGNKSCAAADGLLSVAPDGSVLPCSSWDEPIGNLVKDDFASIWFSPGAGFYKEKRFAPAVCTTCASFTACQGACPLYWRYTGTSPVAANGTSAALGAACRVGAPSIPKRSPA